MPRIHVVGPIAALLVACTFTGQARADAGFPAPSLDLTFLFEGLDKYPNYDFYIKYERRVGGEEGKLNQVEPGKPLHLGGRSQGLSDIFLIAVPRGRNMEQEERKGDWLKNAPPGGLQSQAMKADAAGARPHAYNGYDITCRARIDGDRLEVDWVESNLNSWWSNARLIAILIAAVCILVPVAIVTLVIYLIVRSSRRPPAADSADDDANSAP